MKEALAASVAAILLSSWGAGVFSTSGTLPAADVTGRMMPLTFTIYDSAAPSVPLWSHTVSVAVKTDGTYYAELSDTAGSDVLSNGVTLDLAFGKVTATPLLAVANEDGKELLGRQSLGTYPKATIARRATRIATADLANGSITAGTVTLGKATVAGDVAASDVSSPNAEGVVSNALAAIADAKALVLNGGVTGWMYADGVTNTIPIDATSPNGTTLDADAILTFRRGATTYSRFVARGEKVTYADSADELIALQKLGGSAGFAAQSIPYSRMLTTGRYLVSGTASYAGDTATRSGLYIVPGATVILDLNGDLTATGYAADGATGAGAGIEVPADATLYLIGSGTVTATGGAAANGANGGKGLDGYFNKGADQITSGSGGQGGNGGGGAGAGVGGRGGAGGSGGAGHDRITYRSDAEEGLRSYAVPGEAGADGASGGACGKVFVLGEVTLNAMGGTASVTGGAGGEASGGVSDKGSGWSHDYTAGGGGGGGGGGSGGAAADVGGGGFGGGGGAGGSAGGYWWQGSGYVYRDGPGGRGGKGAANGATGAVGGSPGDATNQSKYAEGGAKGNPGSVVLYTQAQGETPVTTLVHSAPTYTSSNLVVTDANPISEALAAANADPNLVDDEGRRRIRFDLSSPATIPDPLVIEAAARALILDGANNGHGVTITHLTTAADLDLRNLTLGTLVGTNVNIRLRKATVTDKQLGATGMNRPTFIDEGDGSVPAATGTLNYRAKDADSGAIAVKTAIVSAATNEVNGLKLAELPYALSAAAADKLVASGSLDLSATGAATVEGATLTQLATSGTLTLSDGFNVGAASGFGTLTLNGGLPLPANADCRVFGTDETLWSSRPLTAPSYDAYGTLQTTVKADCLVDLDVRVTSFYSQVPVAFRLRVGNTDLSSGEFTTSKDVTRHYLVPVRRGDSLSLHVLRGTLLVTATAHYFGKGE